MSVLLTYFQKSRLLAYVLLVTAALMAVTCASSHQGRPGKPRGRLNYFKDYNFAASGRIRLQDGKYITGNYRFDGYSAPRGVYDGDGGKTLFFKIKDIAGLKVNQRYPINGRVFTTRVIAWGSPAYYQRFKRLEGFFIVQEYVPYKSVTLRINLRYGPQKGPLTSLQREVKFKNSSPWKKHSGKIDWRGYDVKSLYPRDKISFAHLQGYWRGFDVYYLSGKEIHTLLDKKGGTSYILEFQGNRIRESAKGDYKSFQLDENRIVLAIKKKRGNYRRYGLVNYINDSNLTITWITEWKRKGRSSKSYIRILYSKKK